MNEKGTKVEDEGISEDPEVRIGKMYQSAHDAACWMLKTNPCAYAIVLATMYGKEQTKVPSEEIPELTNEFERAKEKIIEHIDRAIAVLEEQQEEAIEKKQEKEKD